MFLWHILGIARTNPEGRAKDGHDSSRGEAATRLEEIAEVESRLLAKARTAQPSSFALRDPRSSRSLDGNVGIFRGTRQGIIRAVDEAVANIMRHSYRGRLDQPIEVYCNRLHRQSNGRTEQAIEILLFDCGPAVDTTKLPARPLDEVRPGGLGLHIIRGSMDTVEYKRAGRLNRLRLVKYVRPTTGECGLAEEKPS